MWLYQPSNFDCPSQTKTSGRSLYDHGPPCKSAFYNPYPEYIPNKPRRPWMEDGRLESTAYIMQQMIVSQPDKQPPLASYECPSHKEGGDNDYAGSHSIGIKILTGRIVELPVGVSKRLQRAYVATQNLAFSTIGASMCLLSCNFSWMRAELLTHYYFRLQRAASLFIGTFAKLWRGLGSFKACCSWRIVMLVLIYRVLQYTILPQQQLNHDMGRQSEGVSYVLVKEFRRWQA